MRTAFSAPRCRHRYLTVTATGIIVRCTKEFTKSRELARAVLCADAVLVASLMSLPGSRGLHFEELYALFWLSSFLLDAVKEPR